MEEPAIVLSTSAIGRFSNLLKIKYMEKTYKKMNTKARGTSQNVQNFENNELKHAGGERKSYTEQRLNTRMSDLIISENVPRHSINFRTKLKRVVYL